MDGRASPTRFEVDGAHVLVGMLPPSAVEREAVAGAMEAAAAARRCAVRIETLATIAVIRMGANGLADLIEEEA